MGTSDAAVGIGATKSRVSALKLRQPVVRLAALFVFLVLLFTAGLATSQASAQDLLVNISDAGTDPTPAGGTISYSVAVSNNDFVTSSPVTTLTLTVDAGTTFIGATGTITGCTPVPAVGPATGVCQSSCRLVSFSGCLFGWPGHGSAAASLMGERVGGPMTFAPGIGAFRVQPDRGDGLPVARLA